MPDFQQLRQQLQEARDERERTASAARLAGERLKQLDARLAELERSFDPHSRAHADRRDALLGARGEAEDALRVLLPEAEAAAQQLEAAFADFEALTDPRDVVGQMSDQVPFLLFPVRLETRFGTARTKGGPVPQLWVRVYPDDCSIDTFEEELAEGEVESARAYWTAMWRAGGIEAQERAAWRGLVASHGSGRAAWIVESYPPLPGWPRPAKQSPDDVVLVVPTDAPFAGQAEEDAALLFWEEVWRADGDAALTAAALDALHKAVGPELAEEVVTRRRPMNLDESPPPPRTRATVDVAAALVVFPTHDEVPTRRHSWSRAPRVAAFPDRFVLVAYRDGAPPRVELGLPIPTPLVAGPDPTAHKDTQLRQEAGEIVVPDEMLWMTDFPRAVEVGMGFRLDLSPAEAAGGFDRLLVVGVRSSTDPLAAAAELEALLHHHRHGRSGFALVPQGTPTNNTEAAGAGYTRTDDSDASWDDLFVHDWDAQTTDPAEKRDGQWLAEWLGIDPGALRHARHAGGTDQAEARAMNAALWPGTLGYWMETMMDPVFPRSAVESTRTFFERYVSGRGAVPAVRIGRQPYGILPCTAFSRMEWMGDRSDTAWKADGVAPGFPLALYGVLGVADADWAAMAQEVAWTGGGGDAHATLLDVVGLHSGSVEYAQRFAESAEQFFNRLNLEGKSFLMSAAVVAGLIEDGTDLMQALGYAGADPPDLLSRFFFGKHNELAGPVVDEVPLSETEPVRPSTGDGRNYLRWLADAAGTSLEALRLQDGFTGDHPPRALLYLLLRYALQTGYYDVSLRLHEENGLLTPGEAHAARREASFIHVKPQAARSESRYWLLSRPEPSITGDPKQPVGEWIAGQLGTLDVTRHLDGQIRALERLAEAPTARLERLLAEHVDCCTYRLDAWMLGLVHRQLAGMRGFLNADPAPPLRGIHLGAYAWLENVRPENKTLTPVTLAGGLGKVFNDPADPPLMRDSANGGYVHAPSLNQAVAAAVLRNGYISNATPANHATLAVNLTSERVRLALGIVEGIRGGQSLGALLGYQFERGLHDRHAMAEVDSFVRDIRRAFPLRARRLELPDDDDAADAPITSLEARNVVDGLRLVEHVKKTGLKTYPWGKNLQAADAAQQAAIDAEVERLFDTHDAVADLALAEGVFQAVQGNYDRAAGTLDAYGKGGFPPEPEVVRTPAGGTGLTHRVGLHLEAGADPAVSPVAGIPMTPRAQAEPALNRWLAGVLPPLDQVGCAVEYLDAGTGTAATGTVTLHDLGVQPIDVLWLVRDESGQAMSELDDRVVRHAMTAFGPRPDGGVAIRYLEAGGAAHSVFQLMPLVRSLRRLALASRPLRAGDLALGNEATGAQDAAVSADPQRVVLARDAMQAARDGLEALRDLLETPLTEDPVDRAEVLASLDTYVEEASARLLAAARFGLPEAGAGFVHQWQERWFAALLGRVAERVERWDARLAEADALLAAHDALPADAGDAERRALLRRAEPLLSVEVSVPPPPPGDHRTLLAGRRAALLAVRGAWAALAATTRTTAGTLLADAGALPSPAAVDPEPFTLQPDEDAAVLFARDALGVVAAAAAELDRRLAASQARLDEHAATADAAAAVAALQGAARALLGDDFVMVPEFALLPAQGDELEKAVAASGDLLLDLQAGGSDFPVDEWLYGAARVRDKLRAWEETTMMAAPFGRAEPELVPVQLPYRDGDRWAALQLAPGYALDGDRLLYTAHWAVPLAKAGPQCGLLLDEWTEVVPAADATTGVAFHYDRPSHEPPQTMLLVTPTDLRGAWVWEDLLDALGETLDMARKRAVEPAQVDRTPYARLLPATLMAVTVSGLTISANLARNNSVEKLLSDK